MCRRQSPVGFPCSWYESEEAYLKLQSTKIFPQSTSDSDKFHKINTSHTYDQLLSPQPATSTNIYMTIRMQFASTKCRQNVDSSIIFPVPSTNRAYFVDKSIIFHNSSTVWQPFVDILSFPDSGLLDMSLSLIEVTSGLMLLPGKVDLRHYPWFWLFPPTVNRGSVHRMRPFCGEECASESVIHTEYEHDIFTFYWKSICYK